jgi:hypothetical protein
VRSRSVFVATRQIVAHRGKDVKTLLSDLHGRQIVAQHDLAREVRGAARMPVVAPIRRHGRDVVRQDERAHAGAGCVLDGVRDGGLDRPVGSARRPRHAESGEGDDLALHLVHTATERAHRGLAVRGFELSVDRGAGGVAAEHG